MLQGKVSAALRWISAPKNAPVDINPDVIDLLQQKHPEDVAADRTTLLFGPINNVEPVIFDNIDSAAIQTAAKITKGAAGPSGMDTEMWKRILCSKKFGTVCTDLCDGIARLCRRLCTEYVDTSGLDALISCRLIPLDKNPGIRPIGIGEVLRRIMGKAVTTFIKEDIITSVGPLQLAAGHEGGSEAAVHAMNEIFEDTNCSGVIFVDATDAFNCLNRQSSLHNIQRICPEFSTYLINTYRAPAKLFVSNGKGIYILSKEGTTQGTTVHQGSTLQEYFP